MTAADFQRRYHFFKTDDAAAAALEAMRVNEEGIDGDDRAVAVELPPLGWALMLQRAADALPLANVRPNRILGIGHPEEYFKAIRRGDVVLRSLKVGAETVFVVGPPERRTVPGSAQ